jgi:hypothetical protein
MKTTRNEASDDSERSITPSRRVRRILLYSHRDYDVVYEHHSGPQECCTEQLGRRVSFYSGWAWVPYCSRGCQKKAGRRVDGLPHLNVYGGL